MTNTFVLEGTHEPGEILESVRRGIYIAELGAGEVDTASGDFSFGIRSGYLVADGRIAAPLARCVVVGNSVSVLAGIKMIGIDLKFDPGAGECGKDGQKARAGVGMPTMKIEGLSIRPSAPRAQSGS
jgi:TldD protein